MPQKGLGAERSGVASLEDAQVPKTRVVELRVPQKGPEAERSGVASLEDAQVPKTRVAELTNRRAPVRGARRRVCQKGLGAERSVRYPQGRGSTGTRS